MKLTSSPRTLALLALAIIGCDRKNDPDPGELEPPLIPASRPMTEGETPSAHRAAERSRAEAGAEREKAGRAPQKVGPTPVVTFRDGLSTPESVLYDATRDRYLVSNINGTPLAADGNGYISELLPDGKIKNERFIAGGKKGVALDAPKGLGIVHGTLYVSDISVVRRFDAETGAPKGDIVIPGATFLNDIAVAQDGRIWVSDSGLKSAGQDFAPTGSDAIYVIDKAGKVKPVAKSDDLGHPNGLVATNRGIVAATFGEKKLYRVSADGARRDTTLLPAGKLDGLAALGDGTLLVSSWETGTVYRGELGGEFDVLVSGIRAPADIGWDDKRKRLLVPRFEDNAVEVYAID